AEAGGAGCILPDLPVQESALWREHADKHGLATVFVVPPSSRDARPAAITAAGSGVVYAAALLGATGTRESVGAHAEDLVRRTRATTDLPVCVGLGVSDAAQAAEVAAFADGVIVGSAFVKLMLDAPAAAAGVAAVRSLAGDLAAGVRRRACPPGGTRGRPVRSYGSLVRVDLGPGRRGAPPRFVLRGVSEKNRDAKRRTARERLAAEREKQKAAEKRRRTLIVGASVVCVLGLAAVIGVVAANAGKDDGSESAGPVVAPSGALGKDGLAIPVGKESAGSTLTVWEDFRCPACKSFETAYGPTIHELTDAGELKVEYHLVTLIDGNMGGTGSRASANAAACAQDAGKSTAYHDVLFANQPPETDDAFADDGKLIELAGKVEGLDTPAFRSCVEDGTHNSWVVKSNEAFQKGDFSGTPTVLLDGKNIYQDQSMTPAKLKQLVQEANQG